MEAQRSEAEETKRIGASRKKQLQRLEPAEDERKLQTKRFVKLRVWKPKGRNHRFMKSGEKQSSLDRKVGAFLFLYRKNDSAARIPGRRCHLLWRVARSPVFSSLLLETVRMVVKTQISELGWSTSLTQLEKPTRPHARANVVTYLQAQRQRDRKQHHPGLADGAVCENYLLPLARL